MGSRCAGMRNRPARRGAAGLVPQVRLDHGLPDFRAAVGAFIGEVDLRHAPMRFDVLHIHRKAYATRTNDKGRLDVFVMVNKGWHVGSPHGSIHLSPLTRTAAYASNCDWDTDILRTQEEQPHNPAVCGRSARP